MRVAVVGNAGSGKSTLSAKLAQRHDLPLHEVDRFMWNDDWSRASDDAFDAAHAAVLTQDRWILDGMGNRQSLQRRFARATHVIFCDLPLWQNYWLLAERQAKWQAGRLENPPGGRATPPSTHDLFAIVWQIDQQFMPFLRDLCTATAKEKPVIVLDRFAAVAAFDTLP